MASVHLPHYKAGSPDDDAFSVLLNQARTDLGRVRAQPRFGRDLVAMEGFIDRGAPG